MKPEEACMEVTGLNINWGCLGFDFSGKSNLTQHVLFRAFKQNRKLICRVVLCVAMDCRLKVFIIEAIVSCEETAMGSKRSGKQQKPRLKPQRISRGEKRDRGYLWKTSVFRGKRRKSCGGEGHNSRLIQIGISLVVFPEPIPISETIGAGFIAAGCAQKAIKSRAIYLEDIKKNLKNTFRDVIDTKYSLQIYFNFFSQQKSASCSTISRLPHALFSDAQLSCLPENALGGPDGIWTREPTD